ncbi:PREDICTED: interleukin-10 receptor subunit beta-like [Cyprinodon variegatus]|uniref:Interleukin-10 receptor subunit beta-like n=1 Tax=Cyprinodon variegatus TaxID=28743 RepID=A0A3Q2CSB6_CYPVA|nr:PREDICTED: interleukin-10 receptor subunit beta-like [Cyprinodon variegatus]
MSAALLVLLLMVCALNAVESGNLSSPTNVRLSSRNLNLILTWDPPAGAPSGLLYTTKTLSKIKNYTQGCENIATHLCNLTSFEYSVYGSYKGQVRAMLGAETSDWVESNWITLDKDTIIGPPTVSLIPIGQTLEVSIKDPDFHLSSLREVFNFPTYYITYWKKDQKEEPKHISNSEQNREVLGDLDPLTEYCVQVHIRTLKKMNHSEPSDVICEKTGPKEQPQWIPALSVFICMLVILVLILLTVLKWKRISQFLWPKVSLPQHLKESLLATSNSSVSLAVQPTETIDPVSVVMLEEGSPLVLTKTGQQPNGAVETGR